MDEEHPHHLHESTAERVRRVAGTPLPAEPPRRWIWLVALTLLGFLAIIVGAGIAAALGGGKIFEHHKEQLEKEEQLDAR